MRDDTTQGNSACATTLDRRWRSDEAAHTQRGTVGNVAKHLFCKATMHDHRNESIWMQLLGARHRETGQRRHLHIAAQRRGSALAADRCVSRGVTVHCPARTPHGCRCEKQWSQTAQARHGVIRGSADVCNAATSQHSSTPERRRRARRLAGTTEPLTATVMLCTQHRSNGTLCSTAQQCREH